MGNRYREDMNALVETVLGANTIIQNPLLNCHRRVQPVTPLYSNGSKMRIFKESVENN